VIERTTAAIKFGLSNSRCLCAAVIFFLSISCSNQVLKASRSQEILKNDEFDNAIKVQNISAEPVRPALKASGAYVLLPGPAPVPGAFAKLKSAREKAKERRLARKKAVAEPTTVLPAATPAPTPSEVLSTVHLPELEDGVGFVGRRPVKDPFRIGEKVTLDVSYFGVSAGDVSIEVRPFVEVNGNKSYHFVGTAVSTSVFAVFYAIDDLFETFVDFNTLLPSSYALHVKETKQLRETRAFFDEKKGLATWWDKKIDSEQKVEERKKEWEIPPYSQNVFSIGYYLRAFQLEVGKKLSIRLAHENENLVVTVDVVRKEHISVPAGEFDTVVVKPKIELNGVFKPVGEFFIWLTDDDRKFFVRTEIKIKIGTIVGVAKSIEPGIR